MFPVIAAIVGLLIGQMTSPNPTVGLIVGGFFGMVAWALTGFKVGNSSDDPAELKHPLGGSAITKNEAENATARHKWYLEQTEILVAPIAIAAGQDARSIALDLLSETLEEAKTRHADIIYSETLGDQLVRRESAMLSARIEAGLSIEEIREYWNQPVLMQMLQLKAQEKIAFISLHVAIQMGKNPVEVKREQRRQYPQYGDPNAQHEASFESNGFTPDDADIYPEFLMRVAKWESVVDATERSATLARYSSFNSMVRDLVRDGKL